MTKAFWYVSATATKGWLDAMYTLPSQLLPSAASACSQHGCGELALCQPQCFSSQVARVPLRL